MDAPADVDVRCSVIVFRGDAVLLVHRDRAGNWVLPGGTPRPGESMASCARRETLEETGLAVDPARIAFIAEAHGPGAVRRTVDLVFLAAHGVRGQPEPREPGLDARFISLDALPGIEVRPPLAGHLRSLHAAGDEPTAAYLGNLWRPLRREDMSAVAAHSPDV